MIVELQPGGQEGVEPDDAGRRQGRERRPRCVQHLLEHRLQGERIRDRDVPRVDDGLHPGPGARTRAGDWDIASVPGGGGSWGGSFLAVPKQSKNPELAAELVKFLTSPASEAYVFKQTGNLPSEPAALLVAAVQNFKNPFFSNAPVGQDLHDLGARASGRRSPARTRATSRRRSATRFSASSRRSSRRRVVGAVPQGRRERRDLISSRERRRETGRIPLRPVSAPVTGVRAR